MGGARTSKRTVSEGGHLAVLCLGTRGDVQPYVALAQGLQEAGFRVTVGAGEDFADFVSSHGVDYWPLRAEFKSLIESEDGRAALAGSSAAAMVTLKAMVTQAADDARELVAIADAVIYHPVLMFVQDFAKQRDIPAIRAVASSPVMVKGPAVYGYSRWVLPISPNWPDDAKVTGYWFPQEPSPWSPPPDLVSFLDAGSAPVYVGFGSMSALDPERLTHLVVEALGIAECRGVLASGWGGLSSRALSDDVLLLRNAPHEWLFPRMAAVVHHGGAGTTGTGLRAGKPTVVCPFAIDQPFWGQVVHKLGVGPRPVPQKELTAHALGEAIREALSREEMMTKARELGEKIRKEDGVRNAVLFIRKVLTYS
jgi:UDP:flavonoid glycosyltransferase YjiC (YdhE family)